MLGQLSSHWWAFVLLGVFAGVVSGLLGLGGGVVVVPTLVLLPIFAFEQKSAQGTALALMVPMALLGAFRYWRNPEIDLSLSVVALIALGALPGVLIGTHLVGLMPGSALRKIFAIYLAIVAVKMFMGPPRHGAGAPGESLANYIDVNAAEPNVENDGAEKQ
jgi:uncharacterized membrane protein YfcA